MLGTEIHVSLPGDNIITILLHPIVIYNTMITVIMIIVIMITVIMITVIMTRDLTKRLKQQSTLNVHTRIVEMSRLMG